MSALFRQITAVALIAALLAPQGLAQADCPPTLSQITEILNMPAGEAIRLGRTTINTNLQNLQQTFRLYTGRGINTMSPELHSILVRASEDPAFQLTEFDTRYLKRSGEGPFVERFRQLPQWTQNLNREMSRIFRSLPRPTQRGIIRRMATGIVRMLLPMAPSPVQARAEAIYIKVLENPNYRLGIRERDLIEGWGFAEHLRQFRLDLVDNRIPFMRIARARQFRDRAIVTVAVAAAGASLLSGEDDHITTAQSTDEEHPQGMSRYDGEVEIIFVSPMPHASIRIGGVVYNYGVFDVSRLTLSQFREVVGFGDGASGAHTRIQLNLTQEEVYRLREVLETDVGTNYPLIIPYNDCVSMTNRAVRDASGIDVPPGMDRSQIGSILYYKYLRLMHPERVGDITYASQEGQGSTARPAEAVANSLDAMMFLRYGPQVLVASPILDCVDTTYDPADGLGTPGQAAEEESSEP